MYQLFGRTRTRTVVAAAIVGITSVAVLAQTGRKAQRTTGDVRQLASQNPLEQSFLYDGPGTVDLFDDGTILVRLGGGTDVDSGAFDAAPDTAFAFRILGGNVYLVQLQVETFVDIDGTALAERGLTPESVVRTIIPDRATIDPASQRYVVYSQSGRVHLDIDDDGLLGLSAAGIDTARPPFAFSGRLADEDKQMVTRDLGPLASVAYSLGVGVCSGRPITAALSMEVEPACDPPQPLTRRCARLWGHGCRRSRALQGPIDVPPRDQTLNTWPKAPFPRGGFMNR